MRIQVVYTDYKNQKISNQFINYTLKREIKNTEYDFTSTTLHRNKNITRTFTVNDQFIQYVDISGNSNYRFELIPQIVMKKMKKERRDTLEQLLDTLCAALYINIPTHNNIDNNMIIALDENKLLFDDITTPDINVTVNIYDNYGIFDLIKSYQIK
jgi:hypothetical protein